MKDSRLWRSIAVVAVASLIYGGHGLHDDSMIAVPPLASTAHAGGITMNHEGHNGLFTVSPDGTTIYVWKQSGPYSIEFMASATAE